MSYNQTNVYDIDPHIAEIYDLLVTDRDDVDLLLSLMKPGKLDVKGSSAAPNIQFSGISILEPFCGTGRILIPLAEAGHTLVGLDQAAGMLDRARQKLARLPREVQNRVALHQADVISDEWPSGFDLVVLSGNCLYELSSPEEQEHVIRSAAASLRPGGYVYVDNDHMEGELAPSWQEPGVGPGFPTGVCADGTRIESTIETVWFDAPARLAKFRRTTRVSLPGRSGIPGEVIEVACIQQKHPVSKGEVQTWLERYGFIIEKILGDRAGNPYNEQSPRAIFRAQKYSGDGS
jgi:SAM-dependent methyltransferase